MKVRKISTPSDWKSLVAHPYAELIGFGVGIEVEDLASHMQKIGYDESEPVVVYDGKILAGRHRHSGAIKAELIPSFAQFDGDDEDALEFVRKDIIRRHLDTSQRALIAAELANIKQGMHKQTSESDLQNCGSDSETTQNEAAKAMNVSERSVTDATTVKKHGSEKLKTAARKGIVSVSDAAKIARAPKKVQDKAVQDVIDKKAKTLADAAKEYIDETGRVKKKKKKAERKEVKDSLGAVVPDRLRDVFADGSLGEFVETLEQLGSMFDPEKWVQKIGKLTTDYPFILLSKFKEHIYESQHQLELALAAVSAGIPYSVCTKCRGEEKDSVCRGCRGSGHIPKHRHEELSRE